MRVRRSSYLAAKLGLAWRARRASAFDSRRGMLVARNVVAALVLGWIALAGASCKEAAGSGGYIDDGGHSVPTWTDPGPPPPSESARPLREDEVMFEAADPTHVDPGELVAQARALALRSEPHVVLTQISLNPAITGGVVDVRPGTSWGFYTFEYSYFDKSRPVGKDKIDGMITISGAGLRFRVTKTNVTMRLHIPGFDPAGALDPRCSLQKAWQAAVKSGVPSDAVASASYVEAWPPGRGKPFVWSFRVDGHNDLNREIHGQTCAVVK